jgi:flagellar basal body-associated protein FliL
MMMKKLLVPIMIVAFLVAFYNQKNGKPNVIITAIAVVIFMFGMMKLSAKTPSKNQDQEDENN